MAAPPFIALQPGDWVELERIINELFRILNVDTTLEDIAVAGAEGDVQYNKSGDHGAEAALNYNETTNLLNLSGTLRTTRLLAGGVTE